jgi:hypothetical protein
MIASGNGVGAGVGVGTGVAVGLGVGETEGGGLNFGPGQPARKMQARSNGNFPILPPFEDEDSGSTELAEVLPDEAFALSAPISVRERSRDDEFEDESKLPGR